MTGRGSRARRIVASAFIVVHLVATCWWLLGRTLPRGPAAIGEGVLAPLRAVASSTVDTLDPGGTARRVLDRYAVFTGTWQSWTMFAPNVPTMRGELRLYGITDVTPEGRPIAESEPFETDSYEEWLMQNSHPPCGWGMGGTPRDRVLIGTFVRHSLAQAPSRYIGGRYVCELIPSPTPAGETSDERQVWPLWEGRR